MFIKQITSLFFLVNLLSITIINANAASAKLNPSNAVMAWDYHDVLVKKDWNAMVFQIFTILKNDWKLIGLLFWPPFWKELYDANNSCGSSEELLAIIANNYPSLKPYWNEIIILLNLHYPIQDSIEILMQAKKQGYKNYLASNMGRESYIIQKNHFPEIFEQFEGYYIPEKVNNDSGMLNAKPCNDYFLEFRQYLEKHGINKYYTIIFIDDRQKNIDGAHKSNHHDLNQIEAILFSNPEQLIENLEKIISLQ